MNSQFCIELPTAGTFAPSTDLGKAIVVVYGTIAMTLFGISLGVISNGIDEVIHKIATKLLTAVKRVEAMVYAISMTLVPTRSEADARIIKVTKGKGEPLGIQLKRELTSWVGSRLTLASVQDHSILVGRLQVGEVLVSINDTRVSSATQAFELLCEASELRLRVINPKEAARAREAAHTVYASAQTDAWMLHCTMLTALGFLHLVLAIGALIAVES